MDFEREFKIRNKMIFMCDFIGYLEVKTASPPTIVTTTKNYHRPIQNHPPHVLNFKKHGGLPLK